MPTYQMVVPRVAPPTTSRVMERPPSRRLGTVRETPPLRRHPADGQQRHLHGHVPLARPQRATRTTTRARSTWIPNGPDFISMSLAGTFSSGARGVVNPDEIAPYTDEFSVQFERELMPDLACASWRSRLASGTRSASRVCTGPTSPTTSDRQQGPGPRREGRHGGRHGTPSPGTITRRAGGAPICSRNLCQRQRGQPAVQTRGEVAVSKRLSHNWQVQASVSFTKKDIAMVPYADTMPTQGIQTPKSSPGDKHLWTGWCALSGSYPFPYGIMASSEVRATERGGVGEAGASHRGDADPRHRIERGADRIAAPAEHQPPDAPRREAIPAWARARPAVTVNLSNITDTDVATALTTLSGRNYGLVSARVPRGSSSST